MLSSGASEVADAIKPDCCRIGGYLFFNGSPQNTLRGIGEVRVSLRLITLQIPRGRELRRALCDLLLRLGALARKTLATHLEPLKGWCVLFSSHELRYDLLVQPH